MVVVGEFRFAYCEEKKAFIPAEERYASLIADANSQTGLKTA